MRDLPGFCVNYARTDYKGALTDQQNNLKVAYYSFYEARARATIRLPDVNIALVKLS